MSLRDNPVVEYLLMVQGGSNTLPLDRVAAPQLVKLLEVDDTELVAAVPPPRLPETEEELEVVADDDGGVAGAARGPGPNVFLYDDFTEDAPSADDGFMPFASAAAAPRGEVRASAPPMQGAPFTTAGLSEYQLQILAERSVREANMIEQISSVARAYREVETFQPGLGVDPARRTDEDRATLVDIFTGGHIQALRAAVQKIHSLVRGPVRNARNAFDFILANDDDVRSLFSQLVVAELTRAENLNPRTVNLRDAYRWNEERMQGILAQFNAYDFHLDGENNPIFTAFARDDVWDRPGRAMMTPWRNQSRGPTYNY